MGGGGGGLSFSFLSVFSGAGRGGSRVSDFFLLRTQI